MINRSYETLDAIAVVGALVIVSGILAGLFFTSLDPAVAPIVASLGTAVLGLPISYGAFRWGNNVGSKQTAAALAQIAGAGPPPPSEPLKTDPGQEPKA